jgi:metal-responsive CopG/Arc/MetJ family transcriptional regulator
MKRPTYDFQLNTRVPKEVFDAVEKLAYKKAVKPSDLIRKAIVEYLKEKGVLDNKKEYL